MEAEDQFTLTPDAPPAGLTPPGVVIRTPEQLADEARLPYEKADRTPDGPLKLLHDFAAVQLEISPDLLVSLAGHVGEHGSVVLFARNELEGAAVDPKGYVIAIYDPRRANRFHLKLRRTEVVARAAYGYVVEVLG